MGFAGERIEFLIIGIVVLFGFIIVVVIIVIVVTATTMVVLNVPIFFRSGSLKFIWSGAVLGWEDYTEFRLWWMINGGGG